MRVRSKAEITQVVVGEGIGRMTGMGKEGGDTRPPKSMPGMEGSRGVKQQGWIGQRPTVSGMVRRLGPVQAATVADW